MFKPEELLYWVNDAVPRSPFIPTIVRIPSEYERTTLLLGLPTGRPTVADRKPDWARALAKAHRECIEDLRGDVRACGVWDSFIGIQTSGQSPPTGLFAVPDSAFL